MWPLTDTALHLIDDANLISARRYGIELDLEGMWQAWRLSMHEASPAQARERSHALDTRLIDVLAHAWPNPRDPVVIALCYQADEMRDTLAAYGRQAAEEKFRDVEHGNGAAEIPDRHHQEAVGEVVPGFVQCEPEMMEQGTGQRKGEGAGH